MAKVMPVEIIGGSFCLLQICGCTRVVLVREHGLADPFNTRDRVLDIRQRADVSSRPVAHLAAQMGIAGQLQNGPGHRRWRARHVATFAVSYQLNLRLVGPWHGMSNYRATQVHWFSDSISEAFTDRRRMQHR